METDLLDGEHMVDIGILSVSASNLMSPPSIAHISIQIQPEICN